MGDSRTWQLMFWVMVFVSCTWCAGLTAGVISNDVRYNDNFTRVRQEMVSADNAIQDKLLLRMDKMEDKLSIKIDQLRLP